MYWFLLIKKCIDFYRNSYLKFIGKIVKKNIDQHINTWITIMVIWEREKETKIKQEIAAT